MDHSSAITRLLADESLDGAARAEQLLPLIYDRLRAIAQQRMAGERVGHTLQATALVHEAYVRLVGNQELNWDSRGHFFVAAAEAMRRILIEHARARGRVKRGGDGDAWRRVPLSVVDLAESGNSEEILILDDVFRRLQEMSPEMADVVRLRFYAGLSVQETANALGISTPTVKRRWTWARAWLYRALKEKEPNHDQHSVTEE